jgi:hypothetical protein
MSCVAKVSITAATAEDIATALFGLGEMAFCKPVCNWVCWDSKGQRADGSVQALWRSSDVRIALIDGLWLWAQDEVRLAEGE